MLKSVVTSQLHKAVKLNQWKELASLADKKENRNDSLSRHLKYSRGRIAHDQNNFLLERSGEMDGNLNCGYFEVKLCCLCLLKEFIKPNVI